MRPDEEARMSLVKVVLVLIGLWIAIGIVGFIVKGLFWLFILACIAFGFTLAGSARRAGITRR
jgi:fatty acid desaturase